MDEERATLIADLQRLKEETVSSLEDHRETDEEIARAKSTFDRAIAALSETVPHP